ncbi:hypothetical protein EHP00_684 [Ecytonucleospora hepatopenaei]|uniref:Uncharacterized protein n=1 Tax=Ecytonucleospora hepatopenaei TaxID=646526 RepID=A0A1W0E3R7_9MICR|nr:hypothetical protein EHP00_684 [Ecytonucleospora hepatopenaei]
MFLDILKFKEGYFIAEEFVDSTTYADSKIMCNLYLAIYFLTVLMATYVFKKARILQKAFVGGCVTGISLECALFAYKEKNVINPYMHMFVLFSSFLACLLPFFSELFLAASNAVFTCLIFTIMIGNSVFVAVPVFMLMFLVAGLFAYSLNINIVVSRLLLGVFVSVLMYIIRNETFVKNIPIYFIPVTLTGFALFNVFVELIIVPQIAHLKRRKRIERVYEERKSKI